MESVADEDHGAPLAAELLDRSMRRVGHRSSIGTNRDAFRDGERRMIGQAQRRDRSLWEETTNKRGDIVETISPDRKGPGGVDDDLHFWPMLTDSIGRTSDAGRR